MGSHMFSYIVATVLFFVACFAEIRSDTRQFGAGW